MTEWHEYAVGQMPKDLVIDGESVPVPVVVRFEDGHEDEDWIIGGELFLYCEKSCAWLLGRPKAWRYKYDSKDAFIHELSAHRAKHLAQLEAKG